MSIAQLSIVVRAAAAAADVGRGADRRRPWTGGGAAPGGRKQAAGSRRPVSRSRQGQERESRRRGTESWLGLGLGLGLGRSAGGDESGGRRRRRTGVKAAAAAAEPERGEREEAGVKADGGAGVKADICRGCGAAAVERGCDGAGRIVGGIGSVPGFTWWPIKAYRPCPSFLRSGGRYRRSGQSLDEIAFGRSSALDDLDISERLNNTNTNTNTNNK